MGGTGQSHSQGFHALLMQSQHWPRDRMREFQRQRIAELVQHAKTQVPFYAGRLDGLFRSGGDIDWDAWQHLPVLTRKDVQAAGEALYAVSMPANCGGVSTFRTSGSSGQPISVRICALHAAANQASNRRFLENAGISPTLRFAYTRDVFLDGTPIETDFAYWNARTGFGTGPCL